MSDDYQYKKHFSVDEANALLPHVLSVFEKIHVLADELRQHETLLESLHSKAPGNGGSTVSSEALGISETITQIMSGLEAEGILIKDIETGLVDFPHIRDNREVLLCWRLGEKRVAFWHEIDAGFRGRQPL